ncbi:MAG: cob(I)yrinic acid a,c-diamide adenosyltransferase, partial [Moraxellaceae bacterium]|nr:cob(I)yrinic acid a,c-diamide adenosyltransferase [Moraxellaceae bacterium]
PGVAWHVMGAGFTWETQDAARDFAAAQAAWALAHQALADPAVDLVVLDEFTYALKYRWLEIDAVLAAMAARPPMQHLVVTGRAAPPKLVAAADTVTDMTLVKHAFQAGVQAMPGIEW